MSHSRIDSASYARALTLRDLTDAATGPHAMQLLVSTAIDALRTVWRCPVLVYRAPPVVTVADNYDRLRYPADGAAREARYSRYVDSDRLLRTQTSAMIPAALRMAAAAEYEHVLIACVGLTYRRDAIDRLHVGEPHQLDLWHLRCGALVRADLEQMIQTVLRALLPGAIPQLNPASHPYTLDGIEVYAQIDQRSVEVLECGLAAPQVLSDAGWDADRYSGLAMGIGLDRMLMLRKGIDDIRLLRSEDPRVTAQMLDLGAYRPVSAQPAIQRDLSLAVDAAMGAEEIGDRVRATLENDADSIETLEVLAETPYAELPEIARTRLGMQPMQKNVLLRLVIRDLTRTLTSDEGNVLRDRVYAALHQGTVYSWAGRK